LITIDLILRALAVPQRALRIPGIREKEFRQLNAKGTNSKEDAGRFSSSMSFGNVNKKFFISIKIRLNHLVSLDKTFETLFRILIKLSRNQRNLRKGEKLSNGETRATLIRKLKMTISASIVQHQVSMRSIPHLLQCYERRDPPRRLHKNFSLSVRSTFRSRAQKKRQKLRKRESADRPAGLELDFSAREREAGAHSRRPPRSHGIAILDAERRRKRPIATSLGLSNLALSRFILFYLLLCPTFLPVRPWLSRRAPPPTRRESAAWTPDSAASDSAERDTVVEDDVNGHYCAEIRLTHRGATPEANNSCLWQRGTLPRRSPRDLNFNGDSNDSTTYSDPPPPSAKGSRGIIILASRNFPMLRGSLAIKSDRENRNRWTRCDYRS